MSAWPINASWMGDIRYRDYRASVQRKAPEYEGRTEDCADLCMWLLIDFASWHHLPLSLWDNAGDEYRASDHWWPDRYQYYNRVRRRIGASALWQRNTIRKGAGPEPGDLLLHPTHAALVAAVYAPGVAHPRAGDAAIPDFPGAEVAARQHDTTRYLRCRHATGVRVDYLNHRGHGGKERAELIFNAPLDDLTQQGQLEVRRYADRVLWDAAPRRLV